MIQLRRPLLSLASTLLFVVPTFGQDAQELFRQGVELQSRGQHAEALGMFQRALATDPSHEDAFELWQSTNHQVWLDMLVAGGESELIAKRMMQLASLGRAERSRDEAAIREVLGNVTSENVDVRSRAVGRLASEFGEFAVPYMVHLLGDQGDSDRRVLVMQALVRMNDDVVLPLVAALEADDAYLRRNVAITLGYIGDRRAAAALALHAFGDESDSAVRAAAAASLETLGGTSDIGAQFLALGDAYYAQDESVVRPGLASTVVWSWADGGLAATDIPHYLYSYELAKRAYQAAFASESVAARAIAGFARCVVAQRGRLDVLGDAGDWADRIEQDELAVQLAGTEALDLALGWALDTHDQIAAAGLCRAIAGCSSAATPNLTRALGASGSGAVRGEAAVAIATLDGAKASAETIQALAEAAAREVLQIAVLIDGDDARRNALAAALESRGVLVNAWPTGGRGLAALRSVPGVDAVVVSESLPDITSNQVLHEIRNDSRLAGTPTLVIAASADADYGDSEVITGAADVDKVMEALSGGLNRDRELANELASRAAHALYMIAAKGGDIGASNEALAGAIGASRPDNVVGPAVGALGLSGGAGHVGPIAAVLSDGNREEDVRVAAANALGRVFARAGDADGGSVDEVRSVANSDGSIAIRAAAARALGRLNLSNETRAELIRSVRGN